MTRPSLRFGKSAGRLTVTKFVGGTMALSFSPDVIDIIRFLEDREARLLDLQPALNEFGEYIVNEHIPNQFKTQGTPKRWAPLSAKYKRWKDRHFPGRPILVRTGRMKAGFRWEARKKSLRIINRITAGQRGSRTPRWFWHQFGTGKMPARPMLQITDADRAKLVEIVEEHLRD